MSNLIFRAAACSGAVVRLAGALGFAASAPACTDIFGTDAPRGSGAASVMAGSSGNVGGATSEDGAGGNAQLGAGASGGSTGTSNLAGSSSDAGGEQPSTDAMAPPGDLGPPSCPLPAVAAMPALTLTLVASELEQPVFVAAPPGDLERLFVLEKAGRIRIIAAGVLLDEPFLDITGAVDDAAQEMGLLGLAFHPQFQQNGLFYLMYSSDSQGGFNPAHTAILAEYAADAQNPNRALLGERRVLAIAEPEGNHNGGSLAFGSDGLLYIGLGDGGGGGDDHGDIGNGQALGTLLGKLLRIDVDGRGAGPEQTYAIPAGNLAEQNPAALAEIWSLGLRNPWRFSFDSCSGDLYIGDVGQESREEIDFQPASAAAGRNYGWRLMEAELCYEPEAGCDAAGQGITLPIASYERDVGQAITGGYVYWGERIPELRGSYLYADYQSAAFFALRMQGGQLEAAPSDISENINPARAIEHISSFGQDAAGELYVVSFDGQVYRIDPE